MNNQPYDSLRRKLVLPFVLLGFSVSTLLSLVTFAIDAELEEAAINRVLKVEMENYQSRRARNPLAPPPSTSVLSGYFLPVEGFPQVLPAGPGEERIERVLDRAREFSVMSTNVDGKPYALFYDRTYVSSNLAELAISLLVGTVLMTLLSFLVGNHLAAKVVRPISRLLAEVSEKTASARLAAGVPLNFAVDDYPSDEIGHLVRALDRFALRLHGFLERESYFSGDVSHELRTPVAVIRGAAEVLVEYPDLPDTVRHRLGTIHRQAVRMGQLLEAMLLLAREDHEVGDPACAIGEVIDEAVADAELALAGRPIEFHLDVAGRPILPVERSLVYVLVSNLLRNACAYTRQGRITVRLDGQGFEIEDTGIGIAEDRFPSLFSRHVKGQESTGHGLGLSIVSRVAQRLGWHIDIQSHSGEGTRVRIGFSAHSAGTEPMRCAD